MKKIVYIIFGICLAGLLFCSCMRQTKNEKEYSHEMGKWSSQIAGVFDSPVLAYMDSIIAYPTYDNLCFYDTKEDKIVKSRLLEENEAFLEISAGKEYFYVLVEKKAADALSIHPGPFYLKLYYPDGSMYQEISMPFQRMFVSDGMIYAYWEPDYSMEAYERKKGHIEATHYLSEKDFLSNFSNKVSDWNQMSGDTLKIASKTFYRYSADGDMHKKAYYCDDKYLKLIQQFYFTEYADGKLVTAPERMMDTCYLEQMYSMMKKKEKNWVTYAWEVNGTLYGVCNIYQSQSGFMTQMDTRDIAYSISFCYDEIKDTFYKTDEYEDVELIYADGNCVLTHTYDGVYYKDMVAGQQDKVLNYDGAITVDVRDGLLSVGRLGNERFDDSYGLVEQEQFWGEGTLLIKKLW